MKIVDSSVWVSFFINTDVHHSIAKSWFSKLKEETRLAAPTFALVEVAATMNRAGLPKDFIETVLQQMHDWAECDEPFEDYLACCINAAKCCKTKGADAVFIGLSQYLEGELITFDREQADRGKSFVATVLLAGQ